MKNSPITCGAILKSVHQSYSLYDSYSVSTVCSVSCCIVKDLIMENVIKLDYIQTEILTVGFLAKPENKDKLLYSMKNIPMTS